MNDETDREAIAAAVAEMYATISGPKGPRDWSRQANSFHPDARQIRTWIDADGKPAMKMMSLDDYARDTAPYFAANDFHEIEIARRIDLFGNIAHVWSAYEGSRMPGGEVILRGVNSIQLYHDGDRWWVLSVLWDNERTGIPLPG